MRSPIFLPTVPSVAPDTLLTDTLTDSVPLALSQGSEKARSEWLTSPALKAIRRLTTSQVSVFSGREFNIDPSRDLNGYVDFLITKSPRLLILEAPVMMLVEATPENLNAGLG